MGLTFRLELLLTGKVIDRHTHDQMVDLIEIFDQEWQIKLTEENGQMYITHFAKALMRVKENATVDKLDATVYDEFETSKYFVKANEIYEVLNKKLALNLPEAELQYILMNHCMILDQLK